MTFFLRKIKSKPKKLLITRTDRIGDFVLTLPVFEAVSQQLNIEYSILCQEAVLPILENNPFLNSVISIKSTDSSEKVSEIIRRYNFDALLVLVNDSFSINLLPHLKHIPVRIGPLSKVKTLLYYSHPVIQKRSRSIQNEAEYNLELFKIFDHNINVQIKPKVYVETAEKEGFKNQFNDIQFELRKTIIFHSGMAGSALNWKDNKYEKLLRKLTDLDVNIILTGYSKQEHHRNKVLFEQQQNHRYIYNLTGNLNLRELIILYSLADIFVGPSTGPTHIANACNLKIFSFYPPIQVQSKTRWQPYLANSNIFTPNAVCNQKYKCIKEKCPEFYCMDQISVSEVLESILTETQN